MAQQVTTHQEAIIRELFHKVFHEGNLNTADQYIAPNIEHHFLHKKVNGLKEWKQFALSLHEAFPDLRYELTDFVIEGDKVAFRWEGRATHKGELWGIASTNKKLIWHGMTLCQLQNGKVTKAWTYSNFAEVFGSLAV